MLDKVKRRVLLRVWFPFEEDDWGHLLEKVTAG